MTKDAVLKLVDDFSESYYCRWYRIVGEDRCKATMWDLKQLRLKIEEAFAIEQAEKP